MLFKHKHLIKAIRYNGIKDLGKIVDFVGENLRNLEVCDDGLVIDTKLKKGIELPLQYWLTYLKISDKFEVYEDSYFEGEFDYVSDEESVHFYKGEE